MDPMRLFQRLILCAMLAFPGLATAQDITRLVTLDTLVQDDPVAALQELDQLLRDPQVLGTPPDLRILLDLLQLRAELLEQLGYGMAAGDAWSHVGRTRSFSRDDLGLDPVPAYERAANLYEAQGALGHARRAIEAAIAAEVETGREGEALYALYERLARITRADGAPEAADKAEAMLDALDAPALETGTGDDANAFTAIDVYYATDRARSGSAVATEFYTSNRADRLELGIATVTIPDSHVPGTVERPSVWRLDFAPNPAKHVLLQDVEPLDPDSFFGRLQGAVNTGTGRDLFVYIHGYNHSFEYATQRAAQIAHDMGDSAVPVLFSWPSRDTTMGYIADAAVVRLSGRRLADFLEDLVIQSGAETIHVLAHSMGSRALTDALEIMALRRDAQPGDDPLFGQVMFAAPDVDAQLFAAMARTFRPLAKRLTRYAASTDWALVSSRKLHGSAPRAGLGGNVLTGSDAFDSVDMTSLGEDMLAHNYFSNDSSALADMVTLFWQDTPPDRRCGLQPKGGVSSVWIYRKGACPTNDLIGVISNLRHSDLRDPDKVRALVPQLLGEADRSQMVLSVLETVLK